MTRAEEVAAMSNEALGEALAKHFGWIDLPPIQKFGWVRFPAHLCTTGDGMLAVIVELGKRDFCCIKLAADYAYVYRATVVLDKEHEQEVWVERESAPRAVAEAALLALERTKESK